MAPSSPVRLVTASPSASGVAEQRGETTDTRRVQHPKALESKRATRRLGSTVLRRHGEHVAGPPSEPLDSRVVGPEGVGEPLDWMAEASFERTPRTDQLTEHVAV